MHISEEEELVKFRNLTNITYVYVKFALSRNFGERVVCWLFRGRYQDEKGINCDERMCNNRGVKGDNCAHIFSSQSALHNSLCREVFRARINYYKIEIGTGKYFLINYHPSYE